MQEKRRAPRVPIQASAKVWTGSREINARMVDLSSSGVAIETSSTIKLGRFVRLRTAIARDEKPLDVDAIVLRRERRGETMRWGMQIHEPPNHVLIRLVEFVRSKLEGLKPKRTEVPTPVAVHGMHGETDQIRLIYEQALDR